MASLFSALTVAVGGLTAQSDAMGNISDNLSNSQTTGFKSIGTSFESLVTLSNASNNDPGGVRATPQYQNDVQGNLVQSETSTSLAITGQGFFAVEPATQNADGSTSFTSIAYTRAGNFTLNKDGYLVNGSGFYLTGYSVSAAGAVDKSVSTPIQVSALLNKPVATTEATYDANLPSSAANAFTSSPSSVQIYDADGAAHTMTFTWTKVSAGLWDLAVDVPDGKVTAGAAVDYTATIPFTFNDTSNIGTIKTIGTGSNYTVGSTGTKAQVDFTLDWNGTGGTDKGGSAQPITLNFGDYNSADGLTQFSGSDVSVASFSQDGLPSGSFTNLSIDQNGFVSLNYNNGSLKTIAQIPIVQFSAQDQLQRISGGAYSATLASGLPLYSAPGASGAGTIVAGSLESSNVDIATQFTSMIQAQQIYSANAKTITTVDNMMNTIIQTIQ